MSSSISNVMKTIINTILFSLFLYQGMAQKIAIPDHKFEEALVKIGIDSEIDGFLNIDKAKAVDTLELSTMMISDLTGIEAFTELKYLSCGQNLIKKIDLSINQRRSLEQLISIFENSQIDRFNEFDVKSIVPQYNKQL